MRNKPTKGYIIKMRKIAVLKGGWSPERSISIKSGENVANGFRKLGYDVYEIDVIKDLRYLTDELYKIDPDYVYNALHGIGGEDGVIQGLLEIFGKPYSNSNVLSSSLAFNKSIAKKIAKSAGVNTPHYIDINQNELKNISANNPLISYPFVVKPCSNGSSIGVFVIHDKEDLKKLQKEEWIFGNNIIVEKYIDGREFTVLVIDSKAIGAVEILPKHEFYDYSSKYDEDGSRHIPNYNLEQSRNANMYKMAEIVYNSCMCSGIARVDFRYDGIRPYFIEINTQPGMTGVSLVPDIAEYSGMSFEDILEGSLKKL
ncbi:MAG: D-alanine--D-alanine ligase [Holosporales bacterium]|jgi:D-alanine-D-alanine ligase|nr:D-alanine--D-alanine ligase [Holosporales bacterium]